MVGDPLQRAREGLALGDGERPVHTASRTLVSIRCVQRPTSAAGIRDCSGEVSGERGHDCLYYELTVGRRMRRVATRERYAPGDRCAQVFRGFVLGHRSANGPQGIDELSVQQRGSVLRVEPAT
jgi:hypothetical protein